MHTSIHTHTSQHATTVSEHTCHSSQPLLNTATQTEAENRSCTQPLFTIQLILRFNQSKTSNRHKHKHTIDSATHEVDRKQCQPTELLLLGSVRRESDTQRDSAATAITQTSSKLSQGNKLQTQQQQTNEQPTTSHETDRLVKQMTLEKHTATTSNSNTPHFTGTRGRVEIDSIIDRHCQSRAKRNLSQPVTV